MFELQLNSAEFIGRTREVGGALDQIPFALSGSLNTAAFAARRTLVNDVWPSHVTVRSPRFLSWAMRIKKSTKENLSVEFTDITPDQRAHLELHARGGIKTPKGQHLAVLVKDNILGIERTGSGISPRSLSPKNLVAATPARALRIVPIRGGNPGIFVGQGGRLNLIYVLLPRARVPASVPFDEVWRQIILRDTRLNFGGAMRSAMKTRR